MNEYRLLVNIKKGSHLSFEIKKAYFVAYDIIRICCKLAVLYELSLSNNMHACFAQFNSEQISIYIFIPYRIIYG